MEKLTEFKRWLMESGLAEDLSVDSVGAVPGDTGLFPTGARLLWQRQDIVGNTTSRLREVFILRRRAIRGLSAAGWVTALAGWIWKNAARAPSFGVLQRVYAENGRLVSAAPGGQALYEISIIVEYTTNQEGE